MTVSVRAVSPERNQLEIRFPRVQGYCLDAPREKLATSFGSDSKLELTADLIGESVKRNEGLVVQAVDPNLTDPATVPKSTVAHHLAKRLVETKWTHPDGSPKRYLVRRLKRFADFWIDEYLDCSAGTRVGHLLYQSLADLACERIAGGTVQVSASYPLVRAVLDPHDPAGSTIDVSFNASGKCCWRTAPDRCHVNWAACDTRWEAEFCRVAESHDRVRAYVKNQGLGLEIPYRHGSEPRVYVPDFIVVLTAEYVHAPPWHVIVDANGYQGVDAKVKKATAESLWVPGVNLLETSGHWAFAEFTCVQPLGADIKGAAEAAFQRMLHELRLNARAEATRMLAWIGGSQPGLKPIPRRRSSI